MKKLNKREKILIAVLVLVVLGLGYFKLVLEPMQEKISSLESNTSAETDMITQNQIVVAQINQMEASIEEIKASGDYREVPAYNNDTVLMKELNEILSGTTRYTLGFGKVAVTGDIAARPTSLEFTASSYKKARAILDELNESDNINCIGDVAISFSGNGVGAAAVEVECTITYYEVIA